MAASLSGQVNYQPLTSLGALAAAYRLYTYLPGTTTHTNVYTDAAAVVPHTYTADGSGGQYIALDARGEIPGNLFVNSGGVDLNLKTSAGVTVWTKKAIGQADAATTVQTAVTDLAAALASTSDVAAGDADLGVNRTDLTGASGTTQHEVNRGLPVHVEWGFGFTRGTGLSGSVRTANGTAINAAITAAKAVGGYVQLPVGVIEYDGTLTAANGVDVRGHGNVGEAASTTFLSTTLKYYGNSYAVDMLGTSVSVATRIQCCWSGMIIDGSGGGAAAKGVRIGWNQRAMPLLSRVTIANFVHYGLHFTDQNWNVSFDHLRLDNCGNTVNNSSGIYKDASIDSGTFNAINFHNLQVEGCGNSTSAAGGLNMQTTTANRGLHFSGTTIIEGNKGTDEAYITNMSDLVIDNLYIERTNVAGQSCGIELSGCSGSIGGGYVTGENVSNNLIGLDIKGGSEFDIRGLRTATWGTGGIVNTASKVYSGRNPGTTYANGDAAAQWLGDYAPRVSANKNGTAQTVATGTTFTKVTFGTERHDLTGCFASSTYTPQTIGVHRIKASVGWKGMAVRDDRMDVAIYLNGTLFKNATFYATGSATPTSPDYPQITYVGDSVSTTATTDYIEIFARQISGSNQDISGSVSETWFSAEFVGRAT
jgi:hypothetical protein